jgi:hypothetical protein
VWPDVVQQLTAILSRQVFRSLLNTPSYSVFLQKGGLKSPFEQYLVYSPPAFPVAYAENCRLYAQLICAQVQQQNALAENHELRAEVLHGPVRLYRLMNTRQKPMDPPDLRRNTSYYGDWWFGKELLDSCVAQAGALETERLKNPLLTDMDFDRTLRTLLRRRLAVSLDWNRAAAIRELTLEANQSIPDINGPGAPMPFISQGADWRKFPDKARRVATQTLPGGDPQFWLPWTPHGLQKPIRLWTAK